ncbi:MAG: DUF2231 domain-containing protein, partial [Tepidisphaeraceae bacterium]
MSHEFINPNLHVVLVHYPIALLVLGTLIELLSFLWRRSGLGAAGRWMILLGALSSIPTATSGIYAARDVMSDESDLQYHDLARASKLSDAQHEFLEHHIWYNGSATVLSVLVVVTWLGSSDRTRSRLHIPLLLLLVIACGLVAVGAWHGGEMVYRYATGVERAPALAEAHPTGEKVEEQYPGQERVEYIFPPMQIHVIGAGIVVAMAMGSMGLSLRAASVARERDRLREEARDADEDALARQPDDVASLHRTLSGDTHAPDALGAPVGI